MSSSKVSTELLRYSIYFYLLKMLTVSSNAACCTAGGSKSLRNTLPIAGSDQQCGIEILNAS